jgi:hypothetical protein
MVEFCHKDLMVTQNKSQSESYITTDGQSASLPWCQALILDLRPMFLLLLLFFRQLWVCWCGGPSPTRGLVCSSQLLLRLASRVFLRSESRWTHDNILLSQYWDSLNLEGQVPVFISPRNRVVQLYPQALGLSNLFTYYYVMYPKSWMVTVVYQPIYRLTYLKVLSHFIELR